jgi:hypothetical protein
MRQLQRPTIMVSVCGHLIVSHLKYMFIGHLTSIYQVLTIYVRHACVHKELLEITSADIENP